MVLGTGLIFRLPERQIASKPRAATCSRRGSCKARSGVTHHQHLAHGLLGMGPPAEAWR